VENCSSRTGPLTSVPAACWGTRRFGGCRLAKSARLSLNDTISPLHRHESLRRTQWPQMGCSSLHLTLRSRHVKHPRWRSINTGDADAHKVRTFIRSPGLPLLAVLHLRCHVAKVGLQVTSGLSGRRSRCRRNDESLVGSRSLYVPQRHSRGKRSLLFKSPFPAALPRGRELPPQEIPRASFSLIVFSLGGLGRRQF